MKCEQPDSAENALFIPRKSGRIHLAGIGGVGMAGLALILKEQGWRVDGCDTAEGPLLPWLREKGIACSVGHSASHIHPRPDAIVRSPAVPMTEGEVVEAVNLGISVLSRGFVLPRVLSEYRMAAVAGTHGKTTTASMLAWIMKSSGRETSFCIGGVSPSLGAVAHVNRRGLIVVEADESDGTLEHYRPDLGVITGMDLDHVDHFRNQDEHQQLFRRFSAASKTVVYPSGDAASAGAVSGHARCMSFGMDETAQVRGDIVALKSDASIFDLEGAGISTVRVSLPVAGRHNVMNALAASAAAMMWEVSSEEIASALSSYRLPRRRFELVAQGGGRTVFSDYAHHPAEINALLAQSALARPTRQIGVFQPHRFSRTRAFRREFARSLSGLDYLVLAPVYAASEQPLSGGHTEDLFREFGPDSEERVALASSLEDAWEKLKANSRSGDQILIIGAGDVEILGAWAAREWGPPGTSKS